MARSWLFTAGAALAVVAAGASHVESSPASTSLNPTPSTTPSPTESTTTSRGTFSWKFWQPKSPTPTPPVSAVLADQPSESPSVSISPLRNPFRYFSAAMSETPVAAAMRRNRLSRPTSPIVQQAAEPNDRIAVSTPPGAPTPKLFISLARISERQGNLQQARRQFQRALSMWPNDVEVLRAAARMEDRQGQLALAESLYGRAASADPRHAGALNDLGLCLARQGKLDQSVQTIERAVHLQPDKALYRNNAATVLVELGQNQKALAHLSAVHGPAASNYNMGQLLVQRNRSDDALAYFQAALAMDPAMREAKAAIARLRGEPVGHSQLAAEGNVLPPSTVPTNVRPQLTPQRPVAEPRFPATARGPAPNTSSQMPRPGYQSGYGAPSRPAPPVYRSAMVPHYLPPVQPSTAGGLVR